MDIGIALVIVILILLTWMSFSSSGMLKARKLKAEANQLREEVERLRAANEALRSNFELGANERIKLSNDIYELVRDLERVKSAVIGWGTAHKEFYNRFGVQVGPELVDRILEEKAGIDVLTRKRLAHEVLVGGIGKEILRRISPTTPLESIADELGLPLVAIKSYIRHLSVLGYIDTNMKITDRGKEALE
jgi:hypothetical protein